MNDFRFIYKNEDIKLVGEIKNNRLIKYYDLSKLYLGNIYRARVKKYIKSLNAYILDLGLEKDALLREKNIINGIKNGDDLIVEIIKNPKDKLFEISEKITISNPYIVLTPYKKNKKTISDKKYNYFLRTKGKEKSSEFINKEYGKLEKEFEKIEKEKNFLPTPKLLRESSFINDFCLYDGKIISNIKLDVENLVYDKNFNPKFNQIISLDLAQSETNKIDFNDISITIDELEALTVVDINSKLKYKDNDKEDMAVKVNIESLEEIAIQLSLRNIRKMLIIDFIRMNKFNKEILIEELNKVFSQYALKYKIMGFSNLDFLELVLF